ncbi:MAG: AhpC/TSA family protein [Caldilineaceae bacterium]|nr:AhpC/TSA family protein [Caldilineaceae bacterium]
MRQQPGQKAPLVKLPAIDGSVFDTSRLAGTPYMLSFFRFASCPFCNLRVHELCERFADFGDNFTIVAIFDSPLDNLIQHAERHHAQFPILADEDNHYYQEYGIEHSIFGVLKGIIGRMATLRRAMSMGYQAKIIKGSLTTMPADFCIDQAGIIQVAYYGRDEGDHLPLEQVKQFASQAAAS